MRKLKQWRRGEISGGKPSPWKLRLTALAAVLVCSWLQGARPARAQTPSSEEYRLKLAFLYNLAKFVDWPRDSFTSTQGPLNICVIGRDPFDDELEQQVAERALNGHPYLTRRLRESDNLGGCHIIFLPAGSERLLPLIVRRVDGSSAITVGESADFARRGGMVNFVVEGARLRFEVNLEASQRARSRINSRFLALAKIVQQEQP